MSNELKAIIKIEAIRSTYKLSLIYDRRRSLLVLCEGEKGLPFGRDNINKDLLAISVVVQGYII